MAQRIGAARHRKPKPPGPFWRACQWLGALLRHLFVNEPAATQQRRPRARTRAADIAAELRQPAPVRVPRGRVPSATVEGAPPIQRPVEKPGQDPADHQLAALIRQWAAQRDHQNPAPGPGPNRQSYRGRHRGTEPAAVPTPRRSAGVEDDDPGPLVRPYLIAAEQGTWMAAAGCLR